MPYVRTNDIDTFYERRGTGPPIVLVHGQWDSQVERLRDEYTTVAYDVRGHGRTGGSRVEPYSVDLLADDLDALVAGLDLDRPVVVGLSMGGCIAQMYAAAHPDRLSGLVLADTFTPELFDRREWLQRSLLLRAAVPPVRLLGYPRVERALVWLQERLSGERAGGDYERIERLRADGPLMATEEFAEVIGAVATFHEIDVDLASITVPTLVMYGEHEMPFVRRHARRLGAALPNASIRVVPGAGHASNLDAPDGFTDLVRELLGRVHPSEDDASPDGDSDAP